MPVDESVDCISIEALGYYGRGKMLDSTTTSSFASAPAALFPPMYGTAETEDRFREESARLRKLRFELSSREIAFSRSSPPPTDHAPSRSLLAWEDGPDEWDDADAEDTEKMPGSDDAVHTMVPVMPLSQPVQFVPNPATASGSPIRPQTIVPPLLAHPMESVPSSDSMAAEVYQWGESEPDLPPHTRIDPASTAFEDEWWRLDVSESWHDTVVAPEETKEPSGWYAADSELGSQEITEA